MTDETRELLAKKLKGIRWKDEYWTNTKLWLLCGGQFLLMTVYAWSSAESDTTFMRFSGLFVVGCSSVFITLTTMIAQRARDLRLILEALTDQESALT